MSNTAHITYKELKPNKGATHLRVEVYYSKGGINYFTYNNEKRGYYVQVSPVIREERGGCTIETYAAFSGYKRLVRETSKKLGKKAEKAIVDASALTIGSLVEAVLTMNELELADNQ